MNVVAPTFLIALALLVPVLIAFLVRKNRNVVRVPSTMVWRLGARSIAKSRRIRDIRRLVALLACLLGVAALVVAAARPSGKRGDTRVFVVDVSASMSGAPINEAKRWLTREVAAMGPDARVAIITAGADAKVALPPSPPGPNVEDAISALTVEKDVASIDDAITLAEGLAGAPSSTNTSHVVVLSDQAIDAEASRSTVKPTIVVVGGSKKDKDNLGITSLFTRTAPDARDEEEREAVITVATSSATSRRGRLILTLANRLVTDRLVAVPEHGDVTEHIGIRGGGTLLAKVVSDDGKSDAMSIDDQASLDEIARRPPRVSLVRPEKQGSAAFFVERAIRAAGVTDLAVVDADDPLPHSVEVAVILSDKATRDPDVPTFFIHVEPSSDLGFATRHVGKADTHLRSITTEDPLLRGVALDEMTTLRAFVATPPKDARSLVDLDSGSTLIAGGGSGPHAWVWLGVDLEASDLVLRVAFPVLVGNVLTQLGGASQVVSAKTVPRAEVMFSGGEVTTPLQSAPAPKWRIPTSPSILIAMIGAFLLALEAWLTFRRKWAT